ncbi:MAG: cryptochrome/photolyase family protein [Pirellulales bacterium]
MRTFLVYPHQLFRSQTVVSNADHIVFVEDPLFFSQYRFHAQKILLHRASMKRFEAELSLSGKSVHYVDAGRLKYSSDVVAVLKKLKASQIQFFDLTDDWLHRRLTQALDKAKLPYEVEAHPHFLTGPDTFKKYIGSRSKLFFTDFYIQQRKRLEVLLDEDEKPTGGKWSFDTENRKRLPKDIQIPVYKNPKSEPEIAEALSYLYKNFPKALGIDRLDSSAAFRYPISPQAARVVLRDFIGKRFEHFGLYEDAMDTQQGVLFHSVLTPALNIGLLSPDEVIKAALNVADQIPMNSLEGFIRQIIGWREFILGVYRNFGRKQRVLNFWNHTRPIPAAFYDGSTGIEPVDTVIHRTLDHAYCHHIERLMILGNFMLLCELKPNDIYQWFMELFIDAYDWVMVPNVYGMSQFADGGMITTKPYISGSSYVLKMSNFKKGSWCEVWDGLYWRFIHNHRDFFSRNPRMSVMVAQCNKMGVKLDQHLRVAENFLNQLHSK